MSQPLPKSAQKLQDFLTDKGFDSLNVVELDASTRTAQDAANTIGCDVAQIVKSLVFQGKESGKPVMILVSGPNRVNESVIAEHFGEPIGRADPAYVREYTGFAIGGIPPTGHAQAMKTFIDQDLLQYETVWAAAGTPQSVFSIKSSQLADLTGGTVITL